MNRRFADAFFYFALWNRHDAFHEKARLEAESFDGLVITTRWVLMEVGGWIGGVGLARQG